MEKRETKPKQQASKHIKVVNPPNPSPRTKLFPVQLNRMTRPGSP
jgi:hypothetical protein